MLLSDIKHIDQEVQTSLEYLHSDEKQFYERELQKLRNDNFILEGKLRGYATLSDICQEYKNEADTLRLQYNKLLGQINMNNKVHSNESPSPGDDPRTGNGLENGNFNDLSGKHSSSSISGSSITKVEDTPVKTGELFGCNDDDIVTRSSPHDYQDKFPMQESLPPESLTGLGLNGHTKITAKSGDLMKFSIVHQNDVDEREIEEILNSVTLEKSHVSDMKKVIAVVKSYSNAENEELKKANKSLEEKLKFTKSQITDLEERIKLLQQQIQDSSNTWSKSDLASANGWVHVPTSSKNIPVEKQMDQRQQNVSSDELQMLKQNNAQLKEANQRWSSEWNKLQQHYEDRISELQTERDKLTKELTDLKISEESRVKDYEKMLLKAKTRANEEENAKEEAFLQLTTANNKIEALEAQLAQMGETITVLKREKNSVETEINVLKARPQGLGNRSSGMHNDTRSTLDLKTENDVLRQQLLVFQEDFDRERTDRAKAQSSKDEYKKQNELLKKQARQTEQRNATLQRQVMSLEENNRKLNGEKDEFMREMSRLKLQLQREKEKFVSPNLNGYPPPIIQSAGLQPPQRQQVIFGQVVPRPMQYQISSAYDQNRMPQLNGMTNGYVRQNSGSQYQATSPPGPYYQMNQTGKQTEIQAGAWTCSQCTYVNYPGRTVCEMCGYIQNASSDQNSQSRSSGNETLHPRGDYLQQQQQQHIHQQQTRQPVFNRTMYGQFSSSAP